MITYGTSPKPVSIRKRTGGLVRFTPIKAMAWFDFPTDVTRFSF